MRQRDPERVRVWRELIDAWKHSGQTINAFCREREPTRSSRSLFPFLGILPWIGRSCASLFGFVFRALDQRLGFAVEQPGDRPDGVVAGILLQRRADGVG